MSLEEEKNLLELFASSANKGLVAISKIVKNDAEEKLGHPVSANYAEDLLNRHGWRKLIPKPNHPKSSTKEQEEFKKNAQNYQRSNWYIWRTRQETRKNMGTGRGFI